MRVAPAPTPRGRDGFTLVELLVVVVIVGLLAGLAQPRFDRVLLKARAAQAVSELKVIDVAVRQYQAQHHQWPPDKNRGIIPPGLDEFLPEGTTFQTEHYVIDYDMWDDQPQGLVGLTIITTNEELGQAMLELLGERNTWTNGKDKFTWVMEWT